MKNIIIIFLLPITLLFWTSCTEEIELDLNNGDNLKIVVDAWLDNSGRDQFVKLSLSKDYFDNTSAKDVSNATVTVSSDTKTYTFTDNGSGLFFMDQAFDGQPGETFTLKIDYDGETYTAVQQMNRIATLEDVRYELYESFDSTNVDEITNPDNADIYDIYVTFQEPLGAGDNYFVTSHKKPLAPNKDLRFGWYYEDELLDGAYFEDEYIEDGAYSVGDTVVTQLYSITKETYDYFLAIDEQTEFRGFVFDKPPANVPTNITNGGRGFFIVSAVSEFEKVVN